MPTRIYVVTDITNKRERLVRASFRTTAIRHAAQQNFRAHAATQDDLERLITAGMRVEQADDTLREPAPADGPEAIPALP